LTEASVSNYKDSLSGLKENVIIGKLIPAGTGLSIYRHSQPVPNETTREALYPTIGYDDINLSTMSLDEKKFEIHDIDEYDDESLEKDDFTIETQAEIEERLRAEAEEAELEESKLEETELEDVDLDDLE
jgi:hypothetical protein